MPKRKKLPARSSASVAEPEPQISQSPQIPEIPPTLVRALQAVRDAVGAVLDLADAAANALRKSLQARP